MDNEVYNNLENGIRYYSIDDSKIENNNAHHNGQFGIRVISGSLRNFIRGNIASFNNLSGICLMSSSNDNIIYQNTALNNTEHGLFLEGSDSNLITLNIANKNGLNGIHLLLSDDNVIVSNTANNNNNGTYLDSSNNNKIFGNSFLNNLDCYNETGSLNNLFEENICTAPTIPSLGLDPFILGLILGLVIGLGALAAVIIISLARGRKK
ncbi:MAG: right-handed parallel beta-helix repeat-containing protein [Candidatus Lokiarchaeota archaeon]|nr:right-handed parallel beta-helix repeat-containing protein [Candidatus Lokiarchaeota archaeon]